MDREQLRSDEELIRELHDQFVVANRTADVEFLRAHMAPGPDRLVWFNLNKSTYLGVDHIARLWTHLWEVSKQVPAVSEDVDSEVRVVGDVAWVVYGIRFEADFGVRGKVSHRARGTEIWERIGADWKMVHFHCSNHEPGGWEGGL